MRQRSLMRVWVSESREESSLPSMQSQIMPLARGLDGKGYSRAAMNTCAGWNEGRGNRQWPRVAAGFGDGGEGMEREVWVVSEGRVQSAAAPGQQFRRGTTAGRVPGPGGRDIQITGPKGRYVLKLGESRPWRSLPSPFRPHQNPSDR